MTDEATKDSGHERRKAALRPVYRRIDELVTKHPHPLVPNDDGLPHEDEILMRVCREGLEMMKQSGGRRGETPGMKDILRLIAHMRAFTPVGIFYKALVVRMVVSDRCGVGESIARDILESDSIRRAIWPAEVI